MMRQGETLVDALGGVLGPFQELPQNQLKEGMGQVIGKTRGNTYRGKGAQIQSWGGKKPKWNLRGEPRPCGRERGGRGGLSKEVRSAQKNIGEGKVALKSVPQSRKKQKHTGSKKKE